jgi:hypothetical protein
VPSASEDPENILSVNPLNLPVLPHEYSYDVAEKYPFLGKDVGLS